MKKSPRKYTPDFKQQAMELAEEIGITKAAKQLGINDVNIYNWKSARDLGKLAPSEKSGENEAEELKRLRKEVNELKKVNQILKSATAFFSQDHLK